MFEKQYQLITRDRGTIEGLVVGSFLSDLSLYMDYNKLKESDFIIDKCKFYFSLGKIMSKNYSELDDVSISNEKNKMITRLYDIGYNRKDVLECMKYYKDDIIKYMELKNIQNEYGKLRYIFTVVENNIKDFSTREVDAPVMQEEVKVEEEPVYVPIKTHKRRSLKDRLKEG